MKSPLTNHLSTVGHSSRATTFQRWIGRLALLFSVFVGVGFALPLPETQEDFSLSPRLNALVLSAQGDVLGPESEWGRQKNTIAGTSLSVILPDDSDLSSARRSELLLLSKHLFEQTVASSTGQIGTWLSDGTLAGIEFELFGSNDPVSAPLAADRLSTIGRLAGLDDAGQPATLGWVYCYDAAKLQARSTALASTTGGAVTTSETLFTGPVVQASGEGSFAVYLQTVDSHVRGDLVSNGGIRINGNDNSALEYLRAGANIVATGTGTTLGSRFTGTPVVSLPTPQQAALAYENLAKANSTFFNSAITIVDDGAGGFETSQGIPISGVVYVVGDITVSLSGATGNLTLIAEGSVEYLGNNNSIDPAVDALTTWAIKDSNGQVDNDVVVSGTGNSFTGRFFAPGGTVEVAGNDTTIVGSLYAWKVVVAGERQSVGDGTMP